MQRFCAILLYNILRYELIWQYWGTCCFGKGRGNTETLSKLFANHNALGQLTNHNTFCFSEGGPSSNPELIESFVSGWGERYCNNVNYVKNNAIFEPPSIRACSSTPPKQNQDFVKEHNRTSLKNIMDVNGYRQLFGYQHSSKYVLLCSTEERNPYGYLRYK